jgi:SAM-dependent methyltransferase
MIPPSPAHYTLDVVGAQVGIPGAGLHAYFTKDLLHPPMVADPAIWADGEQWWRGSKEHTIDVGKLAKLVAGEHVLDIGGGVGGPARLLAEQYGVSVTSVTNSAAHAATFRQITERSPQFRDVVRVHVADCQHKVPAGPYDAAVSINMIYQVPDHEAAFVRVFEALRPGGRFVVDDWMLTPLADDADVERLAAQFRYPHFTRTDKIERELLMAGFPPAEMVLDFGYVGRGPMAEHFERQMWSYFAPRVLADWPGDPLAMPGQPAYGKLMLDEFVAAVRLTLDLYRDYRMTYRRLLVRKSH